MPLIDPRSVPDMVVCRDCADVVGPRVRIAAPDEERWPFVQRGPCPLHLVPDEERWPGFDFNRSVELCQCCAVHPLRSGSMNLRIGDPNEPNVPPAAKLQADREPRQMGAAGTARTTNRSSVTPGRHLRFIASTYDRSTAFIRV